jgi:tetratricopeptide (TPR) repeat protein
MSVVSSIFLAAALVLAVTLGPQTRAWTWGPAMLALALSVAAALPVFWKKARTGGDFGLIAFGLMAAGWFGWRAWISPVAELGQADLLLLTGAVGSYIAIRAIEGSETAERVLVWGIALLLLANVAAVGKQVFDPSYTPIFRSRAAGFPSGFYSHYNEAANYLIASALLVAAAALFGRHHLATRVIWTLIAVAGLAAVYFTRSRGGIFGAAVGGGTLMAAALIIGQRDKTRWFAPALVAVPLVGLGLAAYAYMGWMGSQELRQQGGGVAGMMDNNGRLYLLGVALSCIGLHPMAGGGSRSFSWESFRFTESKLQGDIITRLPEQVHNELIQAATDYGLIGAGLLTGLLGTLVVLCVVRLIYSPAKTGSGSADAWRIGGLAALAGMFMQSCFSFVFHLMPGVILLGICLGQISRSSVATGAKAQETGSKFLLSTAALACVALLIPAGWKATRVADALWTTYFSKIPLVSPESKIDALTHAIALWPTSAFYQERAAVFQSIAIADLGNEAAERAILDYAEAEKFHPHDPGPVVNRANTLSRIGRDAEAEDAYDRAIHLQGGMEPAFRGHLSLANHLMKKGVRIFSADDPGPTLEAMEIAAQQMEESVTEMHWVVPDMHEPRVSVHESLGAAREANGDYQGALQAYRFATGLYLGDKVYYRIGLLYGKMAAAAWTARRPSEALGLFIEAKNHIAPVRPLPQGVTPSQRADYLAYLDETIAFLKGAKIEAVTPAVK